MNQVSCECGYAARHEDEEQIVAQVLRHVSSDHPELVGSVTPEVVRGWIEVVPA
ncbi:Protein of unknown function [Pseudonocardia thermophila]|jgi:Protein of unknown function (DUF1059).|uniref:DUF1059 domain-containing protein n=1 Tax=Pseudonocardia thermophila TaxID=1848 RepID=A0A1M6U1P3_PSETH|nr:DUF1059 domain-containing protein [Pseudonocardia thermophila]SHK63070.1 Protein of unknown function [Pseudonocardia thermophila]